MSLIGPRPETKYYVSQLSKKIPLYLERLNAKPGITGWAQVNSGYAGSIEESKEKHLFDIYYIQNQSIFLDLLIILKSIKTVITGAGL
jgi:lipopolysaccharide/colanic/teichoic acid biosynthesis glycosyltransferase